MGIVFRHDAAAVALPSTSGSRKYGQQLVLQQQQQKYNAQQAGYDRMFQLGRDQQQYGVQAARDMAQQQTRNVYVATNGSTHTSQRAAENASRHANGLPSRARDDVRPISAAEAPIPSPAQEPVTA